MRSAAILVLLILQGCNYPWNGIEDEIDQTFGFAVPVYAISLYDPVSNYRIETNPQARFSSASSIKAAVLFALCVNARGENDLETPITIHNSFRSIVDDSAYSIADETGRKGGGITYREIGKSLPLKTVALDMIVNSSNLAANILIAYLTPELIHNTLKKAGISGVLVRRGFFDPPAVQAGLDNELTARGALELMRAIDTSDLLPAYHRHFILRLMSATMHREGIPAAMPHGVITAQKAGLTNEVLHDTGIITPPGQKSFYLAVLTAGHLAKAGGQDAIARVSRILYDRVLSERKAISASGQSGKKKRKKSFR